MDKLHQNDSNKMDFHDGRDPKMLGKNSFEDMKKDVSGGNDQCNKEKCDMRNKGCSGEEDLKKRRESDVRNKEM
ncbi:hypothetical protein GCK72_010922 [Caenorhabditis remanei]|uniref:Uncharacterized protein n=1 Tax=Caenorhabditis remanei TaxID=31234 RepID=A0A6A5H472_CAERE|nr:hypothetical protein GCK72_010922 [Caenorhabditis remanei]KAF1762660.1 hypothetical protein GCK72_010922 [Caenorhabditis remanei]